MQIAAAGMPVLRVDIEPKRLRSVERMALTRYGRLYRVVNSIGILQAVVTINSGGAEDGSRLRLRAPTHIRPPGDHVCDSHNEVFQTATSAGSYWILSNSK